jgi:hypothetical protein
VPLHSHPDPETFLAVSGKMEGLLQSDDGFRWVGIRPGDVFHIPGAVKHAFRNRTRHPAVAIVVTTGRLGRFFRDVGAPVTWGTVPAGLPSAEALRRFHETAKKYGHWSATAEENRQVGLSLSSGSSEEDRVWSREWWKVVSAP